MWPEKGRSSRNHEGISAQLLGSRHTETFNNPPSPPHTLIHSGDLGIALYSRTAHTQVLLPPSPPHIHSIIIPKGHPRDLCIYYTPSSTFPLYVESCIRFPASIHFQVEKDYIIIRTIPHPQASSSLMLVVQVYSTIKQSSLMLVVQAYSTIRQSSLMLVVQAYSTIRQSSLMLVVQAYSTIRQSSLMLVVQTCSTSRHHHPAKHHQTAITDVGGADL